MGAGLVKVCFERWSHLDELPFRLLVFMAVTVLDDDPEPTFWAGRVALAGALGRAVVDPDAAAEQQQQRRAAKALDRAIRSLTVAGAIKLSRRPGPGRSAEYRLDLSIEQSPLTGVRSHPTHPGERGASGALSKGPVDGTHPGERYQRTPVGDATHPGDRGADEYQEYLGVQEQPQLGARTAVTVPRARAAQDPNFSAGSSRGITLRVLPGTGPPSPPAVTTQPALWPAVVPEEADVDSAQARQLARTAISDARLRQRARLARSAAQRPAGPVAEATGQPARTPGPQCSACGTELDPDLTCFTCRDGKVQAG